MSFAPFALALLFAAASHAQEPSVKEVIRRMGSYVQSYGEKASIVVASERYTQEFVGTDRPDEHRALVADFAIVKVEAIHGWVGYRDVIEVDGKRVTDREDRLLQILTASAGSSDEARRLSDESARFNIGPVLRNFNVPTTALFFFTSENTDRFSFRHKAVASDGSWELAFRETSRPTLVRTPEGGSVPSEGTLWVNPADGTVVRTRLQMADFVPAGSGSARGLAVIDVTYQHVAALDMWLPSAMTETYEGVRGLYRDRITTRAQYSDYRRFQTSVRIK